MEFKKTEVLSNKVFDVLMQSPSFTAVLSGPNHVVEMANDLYMLLVGPERKIIGKPAKDAFPEIESQGFIELLDEVYKTGKPFIGNEIGVDLARGKRGSTDKVFINFIYYPQRDDQDAIIGIVVHGVDITDHVIARKKLEDNRQTLQNLITNIPGGVYRYNYSDPWNFIFSSHGMKSICEYEAIELEGHDVIWRELIHEDDRLNVLSALEESLGSSNGYNVTYRVKSKSGQYRWVTDRGQIIYDQYSHLVAEGIITDVTDRKLAEELERKNQLLFKTYAEAMPQMAFVANADGDIIYFNKRWYDYVEGVDGTEGWGWKDKSIHHPDDLGRTIERWRASLESGDPYEIEYRLRRYDGEYRWHLGRAEPVRNEAGEIELWLGSNTDIHNQKKVEEELRLTQERFDLMTHATNDIVYDYDVKTRHFWWNDSLVSFFGYTSDEIGRGVDWWMSRVHPDDMPGIRSLIEQLIRGNKASWNSEYRFLRADNTYADVLNRGYLWKEDGEPVRIIGTMIDITSRKNIEKALQESEGRFRTLADNISQLAWMADANGDINWYNKRWYDYTGTNLEEMKGWGWKKVHHPDYVNAVVDKISRCYRNGEVWEDTFPLRSRNGNYRWFLSRAVPIRDDQGAITQWFGTNTDITEQQDTEEALRQSEEFNRLILESTPDGIKTLDLEGRLISINKQGLKMLEVDSFNQLKGCEWFDLWSGEDKEEAIKCFNKAKNGEVGHFEGRKATLRGNEKWWDVLVAPIFDGQGNVERIMAASREITELKEVERQKDEFLSIASHELKTPVTSIKGSIQIMERLIEDQNYELIGKFMNKAELHVDKLLSLIHDLLDVSKIQSGKLEFNISEFIVNDIIEDCVEHMSHHSQKHIITVKGVLSQKVRGDRVRLEQVVCNLLTNAIKYSPDNDKIEVEVTDLGDELKIAVIDKGIGIPEEKLAQIFDKFFRVEDAFHQFQGVGLGLYISSEIISRHGGELQVISKEGQGSSFFFTLPKA
ncbi:PAS domain S-box protein [Fulvivirga maritima]|uniref:PAS domain-containing sensor histidine kinase n=1 Tax=Fulvivirga maritima TaxID=2904247 RepID=UPI001F35B90D|nr:PAS domain S-box protein [Fulvivirga maritima]UII24976.1 PAS domain S-box protein [Fulvivirga maritima]